MTNKILKTAALSLLLLGFAPMVNSHAINRMRYSLEDDDTVSTKAKWLPGQLKDTLQVQNEFLARQRMNMNAQILVLARTYGDSIVLRWAPEDYVTWKYLSAKGVNIIRVDEKKEKIDTLVTKFKPITLEEYRSMYSESDSLAGMAIGSLYNEDKLQGDQTKNPEGTMGSVFEIHEDQQMSFAVAVLSTELRRDIADNLAMRWVDKDVKKGHTYSYYIEPSETDSTGHVIIDVASVNGLKNERYTPEPFDVELHDSVSAPANVLLTWERRDYSSYEIERREVGKEKWTRVNERPYMIMTFDQEEAVCFYGDQLDKPGSYEYRVFAHDPFGDLTNPSPIHTVHVKDMIPPSPPLLTYIEIDRPNENEPGAEVWAEIHVEKDTMEADFIGMIPMYYHEIATKGEWKPLVDKEHMMAPTDTVCRVNVSNIPSGQLTIAAVDTAQNVSYSLPQLLRVSDMRPPKAPTGLKAEPNLEEGTITLTWNPVEGDDISYYEVAFANDTTHTFLTLSEGKLQDTVYVDSVALDVNQKYIYYKVRAIDCSTNIGEYSEVLPVIRPSLIPPSVAHLDSTYVDGKGIFMRWICGDDEQMAYHHVYRRLIDSDKEWTLLYRCDADSVKAANNYIDILDVPKVNSDEEYVYAVESFNFSDVSSGLSLQYCTRFEGEIVFQQDIRLFGSYDEEHHEIRLAWEMDNAPVGDDWYFCIWRKGEKDDRLKFLMSADPTERSFTDSLLRPGQEAQYCILIQMEDGRESEPSNVVTIKAPAKEKK